jgi:hypothetical protein
VWLYWKAGRMRFNYFLFNIKTIIKNCLTILLFILYFNCKLNSLKTILKGYSHESIKYTS